MSGFTHDFVRFDKDGVNQSIPARFEQQVRKNPDRIAVQTKCHSATYSELNCAANQIGRAILATHENETSPVALLLEKDLSIIAAMLGVLKTARPYVPLDPAHPALRLARILDDAETTLIITNDRFLPLARQLASDCRRVLNIDEDLSTFSCEDLGLYTGPDALCYIIYTSGSTGEPKGVMQSHRNVLHNIMRHTNSLHLCHEDRYAVFGSCATAQSVTGIYGSLLNGGAIYPFDVREEGFAGLAQWLRDNGITIYHSSASVFRNFAEVLSDDVNFPRLRAVKLSSEPMTRRDVELCRNHVSAECLVVNTLASTETGVVATYMLDRSTPFTGNLVPVGFPFDDVQVRLLDENGADVGVDAIGEICIESAYLSPGYWRRPEVTNRSFSRGTTMNGQRLYRSGDLGRFDRQGCLTCVGRKDSRVKIRGFTVEIGEVEAAVRNLPEIADAAVVAHDADGEKRLVAYVVFRHNSGLSPSAIRHRLLEMLPEFMIPALFISLDTLPRTAVGKLDRLGLPAPQSRRPMLDTPMVAARTPLEQEIAAVWIEVLGICPIGVHDNFFELGGTSLRVAQVLARIQRNQGTAIPMKAFFECPTVAHLSETVLHNKAESIDQADVLRLLDELTSVGRGKVPPISGT